MIPVKICALLGLCVAGAFAQTGTMAPVAWQDPAVKILGNIANGPPLAPIASIPESPVVFPPWGPRASFATGRFLNMSFRGFVGQGEQVVVAGLTLSEGDRILLVRAVGPTLTTFGVSGALARPRLELVDAAGQSIAVAVPWSTTSADTKNELRKSAEAVGAFALREGSEDQVLLLFLKRGSYTCVVSGLGGATGVALLEAYEIPSAVPYDAGR